MFLKTLAPGKQLEFCRQQFERSAKAMMQEGVRPWVISQSLEGLQCILERLERKPDELKAFIKD